MDGSASAQDVEFVQAIRRGDASAEAAIYEKYASRVYYIALRELRTPADAEDVRAETFLRVLDAIRGGKVRSAESLAGFILNTARNVVHEVRRRNWKAQALAQAAAPGTEPATAPEQPWLDEPARQAMAAALSELKPRERAFIRLFYYDELPREEVARRLGIKLERLRLIKSRALKSFRAAYTRGA